MSDITAAPFDPDEDILPEWMFDDDDVAEGLPSEEDDRDPGRSANARLALR